jgi:oligopeptidase A
VSASQEQPASASVKDNPVMKIDGLPCFSAIEPAHIAPALDAIISENRKQVLALIETSATGTPTWNSFIAPLEELADRLDRAWSPVTHMNAVLSNNALRAAHDEGVATLTRYTNELTQSAALFDIYERYAASAEFEQLDVGQTRLVNEALRDFRLSGVALPDEKKARFAEIRERLAELANIFTNHVLDATTAWSLHLEDDVRLTGMPALNKQMAQDGARDAGRTGYLITLHMPSYLGVMDHCTDRDLRREVYTAFITRASDAGPGEGQFDNTAVMREILRLRREMAALLGFEHYAELSIARKMAADAAEVQAFINQLVEQCLPVARQDIEALESYARETLGIVMLQPWDLRFVSERVRQAHYDVSQEALRPYFPIETVLAGMFEIVARLYGIAIQATEAPDTWHRDVTFYEVRRDGQLLGQFYLDPFARAHKRGGAWMAECRIRRRRHHHLQLPVAFLTCNFTPPVGDAPALLTHDEVLTLFHEFGHGLHLLMTAQEHAAISGINGVAWDAVELPSQFMENWCWQRESVALMSAHWQTGAPLPAEMLDKLLAARNFQSGRLMVRQLEFGLLDITLHCAADEVDTLATMRSVMSQTALLPCCDFDRFAWSFGHIFAGGYAAGYYSYLWAQVLSADAFAAFEDAGLFDRHTGRQFMQCILEAGGSDTAMNLFKAFRGREPCPNALLRHNGIGAQPARTAPAG